MQRGRTDGSELVGPTRCKAKGEAAYWVRTVAASLARTSSIVLHSAA